MSEDEDEETTPALPHPTSRAGLEWDEDEALTNPNVSRTYRV